MERPTYSVQIRFNDLDSYGHVNNAVYLTYFEEARKQYLQDKVGTKWDWSEEGILLAHQEIDYVTPLLLSDNARIEIWFSKIGNKSFELNYRIIKEIDKEWLTCTTGKSVLVCFNYPRQSTTQVPVIWRKIIEAELSADASE